MTGFGLSFDDRLRIRVARPSSAAAEAARNAANTYVLLCTHQCCFLSLPFELLRQHLWWFRGLGVLEHIFQYRHER